MTCACATTPDDGCGCCCCEDPVEADSGVGTDSSTGPTPAPPAPIVARTREQLYPVQPTPKETKNKGELLVAVTSKPGLQLKNQGEILLPTTVKPSLVLKNQGVQLSPVVTKGPNAELVGEYIAPTRPVPGMEVVKKGREVIAGLASGSSSTSEDTLARWLATIAPRERPDWAERVGLDAVGRAPFSLVTPPQPAPPIPAPASLSPMALWLETILVSQRLGL